MKSVNFFTRLFAATIIVSTLMAGCNEDTKPDLSDAKERVKKTQTFTQIYKAVDGDWDKLNPMQKADLIKISDGSEVKARAGFIGAKEGPLAAQKYMAEARARGELK